MMLADLLQRLRPARPAPDSPGADRPKVELEFGVLSVDGASVAEALPAALPLPVGPVYDESRRERMLKGLDLRAGRGAEIGPLHNPLVSKADGDVLYLDHCDTETLRSIWSKDASVDVSKLHVDVVWRSRRLVEALKTHGDGALAGGSLDYVVASHVVEHVPDLIGWLNQIQEALKPDGQLRLAVPDRRFTFDYLRQDTTLADVLAAHLADARVPSAACILDHTLNMVQVDCAAAWRGEIDAASLKPVYQFDYCVSTARDALANGTYHDFHCWVFTPASFVNLMMAMGSHDLHHFSCVDFYDTPRNDFEFVVHLTPCADREERVESWKRALGRTRQYAFARE